MMAYLGLMLNRQLQGRRELNQKGCLGLGKKYAT